MSDRVKELVQRIEHLNKLRAEELASWTPSKLYIEDLDLSISECENTLAYLNTNPAGFQMVENGKSAQTH